VLLRAVFRLTLCDWFAFVVCILGGVCTGRFGYGASFVVACLFVLRSEQVGGVVLVNLFHFFRLYRLVVVCCGRLWVDVQVLLWVHWTLLVD